MREFWWLYGYHAPPPQKVGGSSFTKAEVQAIADEQRRMAEERAAAEESENG